MKPEAHPKVELPEGCSTVIGSGLTRKHYTGLEKYGMDKHCSLLGPVIIYEEKSFIKLGPGPNVMKLFMTVIYELS
jgi:hypothetical protein